jgi:hypothetical protein
MSLFYRIFDHWQRLNKKALIYAALLRSNLAWHVKPCAWA